MSQKDQSQAGPSGLQAESEVQEEEELKVVPCRFVGCPKSFSKISNMNEHYKIAHKGRRFICEYCTNEHTTKFTLERHIKSKHPGKLTKNLKEFEVNMSERSQITTHEAKIALIKRLGKTIHKQRKKILHMKGLVKFAAHVTINNTTRRRMSYPPTIQPFKTTLTSFEPFHEIADENSSGSDQVHYVIRTVKQQSSESSDSLERPTKVFLETNIFDEDMNEDELMAEVVDVPVENTLNVTAAEKGIEKDAPKGSVEDDNDSTIESEAGEASDSTSESDEITEITQMIKSMENEDNSEQALNQNQSVVEQIMSYESLIDVLNDGQPSPGSDFMGFPEVEQVVEAPIRRSKRLMSKTSCSYSEMAGFKKRKM